jgi:hypothetical protein
MGKRQILTDEREREKQKPIREGGKGERMRKSESNELASGDKRGRKGHS